MNYSQHDELAALFSQRMTFGEQTNPSLSIVSNHEELMHTDAKADTFVSISAHYTHTTHVRPDIESSISEPSRSPPITFGGVAMPEAMAQLLMQNSIDPASLLPNQIQLFGNAEGEQRLRLLELWRISPPSYYASRADQAHGSTSLQQEEYLAKVRLETNVAARALAAYQQGWTKQSGDFDTHIEREPISPIREPGEPAWPPAARMRAASIAASRTVPKPGSTAEPYIVSGYQNSTSTDPVYGAAPGLWQSPSYAPSRIQEQTMEDEYGSLMQIRNHADWEAMNQRIAHDNLASITTGANNLDDDMMMM